MCEHTIASASISVQDISWIAATVIGARVVKAQLSTGSSAQSTLIDVCMMAKFSNSKPSKINVNLSLRPL